MDRVSQSPDTIFSEAIEIESPQERASFLQQACQGDAQLLQEVEKLVQDHFRAGSFLEHPAARIDPTVNQPLAEGPGTVIGPYKLLQHIGEGGFGVVFMAEQERPVRRRVALKVIKPGMDTKQVIARFEAERQAVAMMDHPNIAKVFDAGATTSGRPYFVMELVQGVPITDYCNQCNLTTRERLELFITICQAVQHAHQKGVIHRDIKPTNVLVALQDGRAATKIIDFGVSKAIGQRLTEQTLMTAFAQMVGTPLYMSPEQAELSPLGVDTRSDIYSLGVLLYELLTGTTPIEKQRLQAAPYDELRRIIREEEPPRPSARISTLAANLGTTVAEHRRTDSRRLRQQVRGDLDWIVMKALEKDRNRRYDTANSMAADVQRYLNDEPVQACPPSVGYKLRKFVRRNKRTVLAASLVVLALVGGIIGTTWGMLRATDAEAVLAASNAQIKAEQKQTNEALRREKQAKEDLLQTLYYQWVGSAANERSRNRHAHAEELLEQCPPDLRGWEWHYNKRLPFAGMVKLPHDDIINRVAWSPDGRSLASGSRKGWVKVWDARTGAMLFQLQRKSNAPATRMQAQKGFVRGLAFSPDGRLLATGGDDDNINLWDVETHQLLRSFSTGPATTMVQALDFSPDGSYLAAATKDKKIRVWNLATGGEVRLPDDLLATGGLAFTPDGRLLTVSAEAVIKSLDVSAGRTLEFPAHTRAAVWVATFSRDRRLVALGCEDGAVKIFGIDPFKEVQTLEGHTGEIANLSFGAGDQRLASTGNDLGVKVWDLRTGRVALALDISERRTNGLAFSPDGQRLAAGSADGVVQILDGTPLEGAGDAGQLLTLVGHSDAVTALAYSPDGRRVVSASRDGTAKVWNADLGTQVLTFRGHRAALTAVAWTPDGRRIASASWDGTARLWDATTGAEVFPALDAQVGPVNGLAFTRNGASLATAHHDGSARVWDAATGQPVVCIKHAHVLPVMGVAFSPDGEHLASAGGGGDNAVKVWNWRADITQPRILSAPENIIRNPVYSPDGERLVAVVATPARVWTWDMTTTTGEGKVRPLPNAWQPTQALFTPSGWLVVVSGDRVEFLAADGSDSPALVGCHAGNIECAAVSPDGRRLATGAGYKGHGEVRIWDASRWEKSP